MSRRKSGGLTPGGAAEGDTLPTVVTIPHMDMIDELEEELARVAADAVRSFGAGSSSATAGGSKQREMLERLLAGLRVSAFAAIQRHCVAVGGEGELSAGGLSGSAGASAAASADPFAHPAELGTERPGILQEEESVLTEPVDHDLAKRVVALEREAAGLAREVKAARGQGAASILAGVHGAYQTRLTRAAKAAAPVLEAEGRALAEMGVSLPASRPGAGALAAAGAGAGAGSGAAGGAAGKWGIGPSQRRQSRGAAAAASGAGTTASSSSSSSSSSGAAGAAGPGAGAGRESGPAMAAAALEDLIAGTGSAAAYLTRLAAGSRGGGGKAGGKAGSKAAGAGAGAASSRAGSGSSAAMDVDDEEDAAAIAAAATAAASLSAEEAAEAEEDAEAAAARAAGFAVTAEVLPEVAASYRDQKARLRGALKTATDTQGVLERLKQKGPATAAFDGVLAATS